MDLWVLRHAKSSWDEPGLDDADRPLAPRGERAADAMRAFLEKHPVAPGLVLCSSALRARQTLARILPALGPDLDVRIDPACYTFDDDALLARLAGVPDDVRSLVVVGHNPALQDLVLRIAGRGDRLKDVRRKLPTGALARIALDDGPWASIADGRGALTGFVTPRELAGGR